MKNIFTLLFFSFTVSKSFAVDQPVFAPVDWKNPPIACVESIVTNEPAKACPDFTAVTDPLKEFPATMSAEDLDWWKVNRRDLQLCRLREVARRELAQPGSQTPGSLQTGWMLEASLKDRQTKIDAVYKASRTEKMPVQVLVGALRQESLFASLGIQDDGGNFSCGVGQINLTEWCNWAQKQTPEVKKMISWPVNLKSCSTLDKAFVKPFLDIAVKNLNGLPTYRAGWEQFKNIKAQDVVASFPEASATTQKSRYDITRAFIENCMKPDYGIAAKAAELGRLYKSHIPEGMKQVQQYIKGESTTTACQQKGYEDAYPFQIGWLMAVGMYNAGPRAFDLFAHYNSITAAMAAKKQTFEKITPADLIEGLYWGGKWDPKKDEVEFINQSNVTSRFRWFKSCVVQRHLARVVQNGTKLGVPFLVDTLEGANGCRPSKTEEDGTLNSSAPENRRTSSGIKPVKTDD